mgnify:CR=1 FL=1
MQIKKFLHNIFNQNQSRIEDWLESKYSSTKRLIYSSVDIRHSGFKIAPVDTNLFPAGFNLLSSSQAQKASEEITNYFKKYFEGQKRILLISESHTRNKYYLQNIHALSKILENADLKVKIAKISRAENEEEQEQLETSEGDIINVGSIQRDGDKIKSGDFTPEVIIVNNDFSSGSPDILRDIDQPVFPPVGMGWYRRRKTGHFSSYEAIAREFSQMLDFDYWFISAYYSKCGKIDFKQKKGLELLAERSEQLLKNIRQKYREYNINKDPYLFIKANTGTYGMGIMSIKDPQEILDINKKSRHSMNRIKEGSENSEVIIQEGIETIDQFEGHPAEPMVYLANSNPIGCTYRVNNNQDSQGNLNSKGMAFRPVESIEKTNQIDCPVQSRIAQLSSLAAARECYEINWEI